MSPIESLVTETIVSPETVLSVGGGSLLVSDDSVSRCSTCWIFEDSGPQSLLGGGKQSSRVSLNKNKSISP